MGNEYVYLYIIIPPKFSVSPCRVNSQWQIIIWIKKKIKKLPKGSLWCRRYFVSTVGINEHQIRNYIKNQDKYRINQPTLFDKQM